MWQGRFAKYEVTVHTERYNDIQYTATAIIAAISPTEVHEVFALSAEVMKVCSGADADAVATNAVLL